MNTRKISIIVVIIFLLILAGLYIVYTKTTQEDTGVQITNKSDSDRPIFGNGFFSNQQFGEEETGRIDEDGKEFIPQIRLISQIPVSGAMIFDKDDNTIVRYVERPTGHMFETTTASLQKNRISNTTIPGTQEVLWMENGESVILRYLNEDGVLKSFRGDISEETELVDGGFWEDNITNIAINNNGENVFYIIKNGDSVEGVLSDVDNVKTNSIFSLPIFDWTAQWVGNSLLLTTKASNNIEGSLYKVNTTNGVFSKLLSRKGLITLASPDLNYILYSISDDRETNLFIYNVSKKTSTVAPFRTLADKCVWGKDSKMVYCASPFQTPQNATYPDDWYKGKVSFSDDIWSLVIETNTDKLIFDGEEEGKNFDIINLQINTKGDTILFVDKKSLLLWSLKISQ